MNTAVPLLCQVTCLLVSQLVPHCYSRACIECGANVGPSQFLRKPLSCHESWSKIPPLPSGPKISSSNESIHVLIFSKRGDDQKVVSLTRGPCILTQTRRVCVTCHDLVTLSARCVAVVTIIAQEAAPLTVYMRPSSSLEAR